DSPGGSTATAASPTRLPGPSPSPSPQRSEPPRRHTVASRIIARVDLADLDFRQDLDVVNRLARADVEYDEFGQGFRANPTLMNGSGDCEDTLFRDNDVAVETEHARRLPTIMRL